MPAGYSGTPLAKKLGIVEASRVAIVEEPDSFVPALAPVPAGVEFRSSLRGSVDVVVLFVTRRRDLERRLPVASRAIFPDGGCWVAWPKRTSGVDTDITEDTVRELALPAGLVDNKVCAIDDTWSGLRIVWRKERRQRK